jgi:hypothetical protein
MRRNATSGNATSRTATSGTHSTGTSPTPRRLTRLALTTVGIALVGGTTACNGLGGSSDDTTRTSATTSGGSQANPAPRDASLDDRTAVASRSAGFDDTTIRFDLLSLRRTGNLSVLRFTATNTTPGTVEDTDKEWLVLSDLGSGSGEYSVNGVYLVDPAHSKKYPTATDSADDCVCSSTQGVDIVPTQTSEFSATFAAPPADVTTVDVYVPGAGTVENVPVS